MYHKILKIVKHKYGLLILIAISVLFYSCAQENPNLVSPEPASKTVTFRILNFCESAQSVYLGESIETESAAKYSISAPVSPPMGDSLTLKIKEGAALVYASPIKFRLVRNTKYSILSLPNPKGHDPAGAFNTPVILGTALKLMLNEGKSYLTAVNCYPDSTVQFRIALGCPNGFPIATSLLYRFADEQKEIDAGTQTISLVMNKNGFDTLINLYDLTLVSKSDIALIIYQNAQGNPDLWLLDLSNPDKSAFSPAPVNNSRNTFIRTINYSTSDVQIEKDGGLAIDNSAQNTISSYKTISSCISSSQDTILAISGTDTSRAETTLEVNKKFTVLVFDSANIKANLTIIANPVNIPSNLSGVCAIRVVNAAFLSPSLTVSMGARWDSTSIGYRSGEVLASNLPYGKISNAVYVNAGRAPLTLFSTEQPPNLLLPALTSENLMSGKNYLIVVRNDAGSYKMDLIEEETENTQIENNFEIKQGVFTQIVHSNSKAGILSIGIADINAAQVYYKGFLSTVMPAGDNQIIIQGVPTTYNVDNVNKRGLVIIGDNNVIYNKSELPMGSGRTVYRFKFINISSAPVKCVLENYNYSEIVNSGDISPSYYENGLPGKLNISFVNPDNSTALYRLDGVEMSFGLNYLVIFSGTTAIVKSEY